MTDDRFDNAKTRLEGAAPGKLPEAVDAARARDKIGAFTCSLLPTMKSWSCGGQASVSAGALLL